MAETQIARTKKKNHTRKETSQKKEKTQKEGGYNDAKKAE